MDRPPECHYGLILVRQRPDMAKGVYFIYDGK
jgi:hypothetical protein